MNKYRVKLQRTIIEEIIVEANSANEVLNLADESTKILKVEITKAKE